MIKYFCDKCEKPVGNGVCDKTLILLRYDSSVSAGGSTRSLCLCDSCLWMFKYFLEKDHPLRSYITENCKGIARSYNDE
jgi:hypothetical protein